MPLVTVLTLAATGSEMNRGAVITNLTAKQKLGVHGPNFLPKVSFLDPTWTFSVNRYQTAAGSADIMSHLIENYFSTTENTDVQRWHRRRAVESGNHKLADCFGYPR